MTQLRDLLAGGGPLLMPGAHDALSARMIQEAGFSAYGVGGAALSATQLALPDIGILSFGEYRDAVSRIMEGSSLPVLIDGENGFGDVKAVTRTVRCLERLGAGGIAFEDLNFPPRLGSRPTVIPVEDMAAKLGAALAARRDARMMIVARTDAAYAVDMDEAIARITGYAALGVDAVIVPGLPDRDAYQRLRDAVALPILAIVVPGSPWFAPTAQDLQEIGIEAGIYPAALLTRMVSAIDEGLTAIRTMNGAAAGAIDMGGVARLLHVPAWTEIDQRFDAGTPGT